MTEPVKLVIRDAIESDLARIIELLSDDFLGSTREAADTIGISEAYRSAFQEIEASSDNRLLVACRDDDVVGTFQLTMIPGLSFTGGKRAQIEAVRIDESLRGQGAGKRMIEFGIAEARAAGCCMVQLTMNKQRVDTLRFYERLGFVATHEGFKLML